MRIVVDECTGAVVARWLQSLGHDVISIATTYPSWPDHDILALAVSGDRIVITNDKDFGDIVFHEGREHRGIVLLRLTDNRVSARIAALERLLADPPDDLSACFVVVTERAIRVTRRGE